MISLPPARTGSGAPKRIAMAYDPLIRGDTLVDGTGALPGKPLWG
jgi:hypothetical protein